MSGILLITWTNPDLLIGTASYPVDCKSILGRAINPAQRLPGEPGTGTASDFMDESDSFGRMKSSKRPPRFHRRHTILAGASVQTQDFVPFSGLA